MRRIATSDIGGTHARFAIAELDGSRVRSVGAPTTLKTSQHASFQTAWEELARAYYGSLPHELAMAFAGPVAGEVLKLTNIPWVIRPQKISQPIRVHRFTEATHFGEVAHAVARLDSS